MSRTTLAGAKAEVVALLTAANLVPKVYDYEPGIGEGIQRPKSISVSTAGMAPTDWRLAVRLYVSTNTNVEASDNTMAALLVAADGALGAGEPRSDWVVTWVQHLDCLVATTYLLVGREDF